MTSKTVGIEIRERALSDYLKIAKPLKTRVKRFDAKMEREKAKSAEKVKALIAKEQERIRQIENRELDKLSDDMEALATFTSTIGVSFLTLGAYLIFGTTAAAIILICFGAFIIFASLANV